MIQNVSIDLKQLVKDICLLVVQSSYIIQKISQNLKQIVYKDINKSDPVTQADYLVQDIIVRFINSKYPSLKIVGEQSTQADDQICRKVFSNQHNNLCNQNLNSLNKDMTKCFPAQQGKTLININDLCVWIDPLDCTRGFVQGNKEDVTILVGISQKNQPIAGVIGHPFKKSKQNSEQGYEFSPCVYMGSKYLDDKKCCYEYQVSTKSWIKHNSLFNGFTEQNNLRKVAVSSRRIPLRQHSLIDNLKLQQVKIGGAGSKFIKLIRKQVGSLMFIDAKTSKWDSCAGEAIILAMGGFSLKPNLESIVYDSAKYTGNQEGFIVALDENIWNQINEYIRTQKFQQGFKHNQFQLSDIKQIVPLGH